MKGLMTFLIFLLLLSCKPNNSKNNEANENVTVNNELETSRAEPQEKSQKIMFVSGLKTVDVWSKGGNRFSPSLDFPEDFLGNISFGEEVILLDRIFDSSDGGISWSLIKYNDLTGYIVNSLLSESKEKCELIDVSGIEKYLGIYKYNRAAEYIGNIDNISNVKLGQLKGNFSSKSDWGNREVENHTKNNYIEVKLFDRKRLLFLDYQSELNLYNEYLFTFPNDYFEIQQIDHSGSMKPHYYEYYFIENGLVYRAGDYTYISNDFGDEVYSSVFEIYYKK